MHIKQRISRERTNKMKSALFIIFLLSSIALSLASQQGQLEVRGQGQAQLDILYGPELYRRGRRERRKERRRERRKRRRERRQKRFQRLTNAFKKVKSKVAQSRVGNAVAKTVKATSNVISGVGTGIGKSIGAIGAAVVNPVNTARALRNAAKAAAKKAKEFGKNVKENGINAATRKVIIGAKNGIKNVCKGKNKASCFGELAGSVAFGGSGLAAQAVQREAQKEAKKHGDKDNYLQVNYFT
jgi:hypothetical protein